MTRAPHFTDKVGLDRQDYVFDFFDYRENGSQVYQPGDTVIFMLRAAVSGRTGYVWEFSPACYERPYEDVDDWSAAGYSGVRWGMTLPNLEIVEPLPIAGLRETIYGTWVVWVKWYNASSPYLIRFSRILNSGGTIYEAPPTDVMPRPGDNMCSFEWDTQEFQYTVNGHTYYRNGTATLAVSLLEAGRVDPLDTRTVEVTLYNQEPSGDPVISPNESSDPSGDIHKFLPEPPAYPEGDPNATVPQLRSPYRIGNFGPNPDSFPGISSKNLQPRTSGSNPHTGLDLLVTKKPVFAPWSGWVVDYGAGSNSGNWLLLRVNLDGDPDIDPGEPDPVTDTYYCLLEHLMDWYDPENNPEGMVPLNVGTPVNSTTQVV